MKDDVLPQFIIVKSLEKSFRIFYIAGDANRCAGGTSLKMTLYNSKMAVISRHEKIPPA